MSWLSGYSTSSRPGCRSTSRRITDSLADLWSSAVLFDWRMATWSAVRPHSSFLNASMLGEEQWSKIHSITSGVESSIPPLHAACRTLSPLSPSLAISIHGCRFMRYSIISILADRRVTLVLTTACNAVPQAAGLLSLCCPCLRRSTSSSRAISLISTSSVSTQDSRNRRKIAATYSSSSWRPA
eukprot:Pompholyxophrys_punicea_v1_NODE_21_length_5692_cov_19.735675.p3 type:complete len:184 gc:universal NODE_21_length_5692_cov_19.735675:3815-4366(+)